MSDERHGSRLSMAHEDTAALGARIAATVAAVRLRVRLAPRVGIVLGSGLGAFGDMLEGLGKVPYRELPYLPKTNISGHDGFLCFGHVADVPVVCMQGRVHLYEGHGPEAVVHGVRTMAGLGVECVLLTNAAGALEPTWAPGDFMLIEDHLNLTGASPLVGPNDEAVGPRFPDMAAAYDASLRAAAHAVARDEAMTLRQGVYAGLVGPTYETPAEVRMLRALGAHAVGMSTVHEVIALRHMGVRVGALSCITNAAAGLSRGPLSHAEVERTARARRDDFLRLLRGWITRVGCA